MGEFARDILDGFRDETGEIIDGTAPGYPRQSRESVERTRRLNQAAVAFSHPFPCPGCGRSFRHSSGLATHRTMKAH